MCVASASVDEIDTLNILHATMLAMKRAVEGLSLMPTLAQVDGNRCPTLMVRAEAIVSGDALVPASRRRRSSPSHARPDARRAACPPSGVRLRRARRLRHRETSCRAARAWAVRSASALVRTVRAALDLIR
jgi:hypothetical protein